MTSVQLLWWHDADRTMTRLEEDPSLADVLLAVRRTLGRLERDPYDRRLRTRQFAREGYVQVRTTPTTHGDWWIFWMSGPEPDEITIVAIAETSV